MTTGSTSPDQQIRLGIIGTGLAVEKLHWPALQRLTDQFRVTAFTDPDDNAARKFLDYSGTPAGARVADADALLARDDVDAVLISLPIPDNLPATRSALAAGKHVICEKPAGANADEGRAFVELSARYPDQVTLIAENMFYLDHFRVARSLLDSGILGRLHLVAWRNVSRLVPTPGNFSSTPWRHHPGYVGGPHLDGGVHHMATLRLLCGDVELVSGATQDANSTHGGPSDLVLQLHFVNDAIGSYVASYPEMAVPKEDNALRLYGTEGVMVVGGRRGIEVHRPDGTVETWRVEGEDGGYYNEFLNFHEAVTGAAPVVGTVAQSWRNMELIIAGLDSAAQGQTVVIPDWPTELSSAPVPLWCPPGVPDIVTDLGDRLTHETRRAEKD